MPTIDFYLLNTPQQEDVYRFLCRLVDKVYQQQHQAYIHTRSLEEAERLDDLLWTFRDISFIPHQIGEPNPPQLPTLITIGIEKPKQHHATDILFNLTQEAPHFFHEFARVIEVVTEEKNQRNQARKKYKFYKEQNCPLTTHTISLPC